MEDLKWSNWRIEHYKSIPCDQEFGSPVTTFVYKPGKESNLIVGLENGSLLLFDLSHNKSGFNLKKMLAAHKAPVTSIQFTEKYLITGDKSANIRVYDLENKKWEYSFEKAHEHSIFSLETNGNILISTSINDGKMNIWNMNGYSCLKSINMTPCDRILTKLNTSGTLLLVAYPKGIIEVWDATNQCKITSANVNSDDANEIVINQLAIIDDSKDSIHFNVLCFDGFVFEWQFTNNELKLVKSHRNLPKSNYIWINHKQNIAYCSDDHGNILAVDLDTYEKLYDLKPKLNEPIVLITGDDNYLISISSSHQLMMFDFQNVEILYPTERKLLVNKREEEKRERMLARDDSNGIYNNNSNNNDRERRNNQLTNRKTRSDVETKNNNSGEVIKHNNIRQEDISESKANNNQRQNTKKNGKPTSDKKSDKDSNEDDNWSEYIPAMISVGFLVLGFVSYIVLNVVVKID